MYHYLFSDYLFFLICILMETIRLRVLTKVLKGLKSIFPFLRPYKFGYLFRFEVLIKGLKKCWDKCHCML